MKKQHIIFSFFAALLALSAVSCKKDQDVVTLNAVIQKVSNDSKVYINDHTPYWHNGDQIRINDVDYTLQTALENSAQIPNVANSTSGYRAIFPAGILTNSDANINSSSSVAVTLPATQVFEMVGTHQRVDVPMGAFIDRGNTLQFHNLCSVVRVYVSNAINAQLPITGITITAESAYLSGMGTATITGESTDAIVIPSSTGSHSVSLCKTDNTPMKTVEPLATEYFDVIVPEFSTRNDVTVTVTTPTGYKSIPIENATLAHNTITTVTVNVDELSQTTAELVDGPTFNAAIPQNATAVRFEYNNVSVTSGTILSIAASLYPIYGNLNGTEWVVSTPANRINANANCNGMFGWQRAIISGTITFTFLLALTSIDFGGNFNTSNVTEMRAMFHDCRNLTSLNLSNFNTTNVTTMFNMFSGCRSLASLDLSSFNTSNVMDMGSMFSDCRSLISLNLSNFNTSNVTNMSNMFYVCTSLTSLNLSNFNTVNVTNMSGMFSACYSLTSLNLSNFNTSNVSIMSTLFNNCSSLTSLNLSNFNTSNVWSMYRMFNGCNSLTSLNLSNFNTANVTDMQEMFSGCSNLTSIDLYNFNTGNVTDMSYMFQNCNRLTSLNLYNFDMSGLTSHTLGSTTYSGKYQMCSGLASISGACAITCPTAIKTELQSGTSLNNSLITWYTH